MRAAFLDVLATLLEAHGAVLAELDRHAEGRLVDRSCLPQLRNAAAEFTRQTDLLIVLMQEHECDGAVIWEAHELHEFFRDAADRAACLLSAPRGRQS